MLDILATKRFQVGKMTTFRGHFGYLKSLCDLELTLFSTSKDFLLVFCICILCCLCNIALLELLGQQKVRKILTMRLTFLKLTFYNVTQQANRHAELLQHVYCVASCGNMHYAQLLYFAFQVVLITARPVAIQIYATFAYMAWA